MTPKKVYKVNLSRVPKIAWRSILAEIAEKEGIDVKDIVVQG